jgi:hypothetical protein
MLEFTRATSAPGLGPPRPIPHLLRDCYGAQGNAQLLTPLTAALVAAKADPRMAPLLYARPSLPPTRQRSRVRLRVRGSISVCSPSWCFALS